MKNISTKSLFGKSFLFLIFAGLITAPLSGCKVQYSFTGASISPEVKTVSIDYFQNLSTLVNPSLSSKFTEQEMNYLLMWNCGDWYILEQKEEVRHYIKVVTTEKYKLI